jgi:predicted kinase
MSELALRRLFVLIGAPGVGKTTYAAQHGWETYPHDLDASAYVSAASWRRCRAVALAALRAAMQAQREPLCWDEPALTARRRSDVVALARAHGYTAHAVVLKCSESERRRRMRARGRVVRGAPRRLEPPSLREGFASVQRQRT